MKYEELCKEIIKEIGGETNIKEAYHCMTRLRLVLKNKELVDFNGLNKIEGILKVNDMGPQLQLIIGSHVSEVYNDFCSIANIKKETVVDESDTDDTSYKQKLSLKDALLNILDTVSGCVVPLLPMFIAGGLISMIKVILSPTALGVIETSSELYIFLDFLGNSAFYFLPIMLGYTTSKKFNSNPAIGMMLGAMLIHPTFINIVNAGEEFSLLGISVSLVNYSSSVLPTIMLVWIASYLEKFFDRNLPVSIRSLLKPFLTVLIMAPLGFIVIAPLGSTVGKYIADILVTATNILGPIGNSIIAALYVPLVMTGMHVTLFTQFFFVLLTEGTESVFFPAVFCATSAVAGMCIGFALKTKSKSNKSLGFSFAMTQWFAALTEPAIYGIALKYKKPFIAQIIGAACGGLYCGIMKTTLYTASGSTIFGIVGYIGENSMNVVHQCIGMGIALVVAAVLTYILGFDEEMESNRDVS